MQETNQRLDDIVASAVASGMDPQQAEINAKRQDLLQYLNGFITESQAWRRQSYEDRWHMYRRNCESIIDPVTSSRKESWQSQAFIPVTASHKEDIQAALFRMILGARPVLEIRSRVEREDDQSDNIRDLILRDMEKTRFEVELNKIFDDACVFGSGFCRVRFEETYQERKLRNPVKQALNIFNPKQLYQSMTGSLPTVGFEETTEKILTYRGVRLEHLSIWDIFPDPKALAIAGNQVAYRYYPVYGDIVSGVEDGYYFPEAAAALRYEQSNETESSEKSEEDADRLIAPSNLKRTEYGKRLECFEYFGRLPKKWAFPGQEFPDPEALVPCRVLFNVKVILAIELNDDYEGEPPIYKCDYLPVTGQFYGRGIAEMLKDLQLVTNETVNQRIDNVALVMNRGYAVIEKALKDRNDLVSKPGFVVRLDGKVVTDVRQALMPFDFPEVTSSAYRDVQEMERYAQERTSKRSNLGAAGLSADAANKTAHGLEMVKQQAGDKFGFIGMLMEFGFMYDIFKAFWKTIYANINPDDVIAALGEKRASTFKLLTPEEVLTGYQYEPQGIFTMENKALTQQRIQLIADQFGQQPWFSWMGAFDKVAKANNIDPETLKLTPEEMQLMMQAQQNLVQAQTPLPDKPPEEPREKGK